MSAGNVNCCRYGDGSDGSEITGVGGAGSAGARNGTGISPAGGPGASFVVVVGKVVDDGVAVCFHIIGNLETMHD